MDIIIVDELLTKYGGQNQSRYRDSLKIKVLQRHEIDILVFDSLLIDLQKDLKYYHSLQEQVGEKLEELKKEEKI